MIVPVAFIVAVSVRVVMGHAALMCVRYLILNYKL